MIYVMLADGFEEIEGLTVVDVLRRGELDVQSVSIMDAQTVTGAHGITVVADTMFADANFDDCELVVLPGGMPGTTNLDAYEPLEAVLRARREADLPIAAICAAPMVFGHKRLLAHKNATIYPGMEEELFEAIHVDAHVVQDGTITTSQGPATAMEFALHLLAQLKGQDVADAVGKGLLFQR